MEFEEEEKKRKSSIHVVQRRALLIVLICVGVMQKRYIFIYGHSINRMSYTLNCKSMHLLCNKFIYVLFVHSYTSG